MAQKINSSKLLPSSSLIKKGSAIIIADKKEILSTLKTIRISSGEKKDTGEVSGESKNDELNEIHKKLLTIQKLLGSELKSLQSKTEETRKEKEKKEFEEGEKKLEVPKVKGLKLPSLRVPGVSFLGGLIERIKRFIFFTALAWLFPKIIEFLPKLKWIANLIGGVYKFAEGLFGKLFDGFMSLVKFGGDLKDKTIGFIAQLKGGNYQKEFEKLENLFNTFANASIVAGVLGLDIGIAALKEWNRSRKPPKPTDGKPPKPTDGKPPKPSVTTGKGGKPRRLPIGRRAPVTTGKGGKPRRLPIGRRAPVTTGKGGKPPSWWDKIFKGPFAKLKGPLSKFAGAVVPGVGAVVGAADAAARFKSGDKLGGTLASASASLDALAAGSAILAITGIGAAVPAAFGTISMGIDVFLLIRDILKSFNIPIFSKGGRIVNDEEKDTEVTRGGKYVNRPARRTIKAAVIKKPPKVAPVDSSPGKDVGGELKIQRIFPSPESSVIGKGKVKKGAKKTLIKKAIGSPDVSSPTTEDRPNPFNVLTSTAKTLKEIPLIGGIMGSGVDLAMGQKIESKKIIKPFSSAIKYLVDTLTVEGINFNITSLFNDMKAFNEGGVVPPSRTLKRDLFDVEGLLDKVLGPIIQQKVNEAIQNIQNELKKKGELLGSEGGGGGDGELTDEDGEYSEGGIATQLGVPKGVSVAKKLIADLGITPAQAAGIVGNFLYESAGMNPAEVEGSPYGVPEKPPALGTIGRGYGWAQWTNSAPGDRLDKFLKSYGGDKGKIATDNDNYKFLITELRGPETLEGMPTDDPQAASDWFRVNWERAGVPADQKRRKETMEVYEKIKGLSREQAKRDVAEAGARRRGRNLEDVGNVSSTLKGKFGLLSLGGSYAPGGDRQLSKSSTFRDTHKHHNKPDSDSYNQREFGIPRDYVITRGPQSKDKGAPVPSGFSGVARVNPSGFGYLNTVDIYSSSGKKIARSYHHNKIKVKDGQRVSPKTIIAEQGNTGTGAVHVHMDTSPSNHTRWIKGITGSYQEGGLTKNYPHIAMIGEKGAEFVIDADSTKAIEKKFPGLLYSINKAKGYGAVKALLNYFKRSRSKAEPIRKQKIYPVQERSLDRIDYSTVVPSNPIADKKPNVPDLRSFASYETYAPSREDGSVIIPIIIEKPPQPIPIKQESNPIMFPIPISFGEVNNTDSYTKGRGY